MRKSSPIKPGKPVVTQSNLFNVEGYAVIVTGGASGIGLGYTEALAAHGARVTMIDVHPDRIEEETRRLRGLGMDVAGRVVDVTQHQALDAAFADITRGYGRLDVVFANAGIDSGVGFVGAWVGSDRPRVPEGALECYSDERWNKVIAVNLDGVFATCRAAARHMRSRKNGRIIITTSAASSRIEPAIGAAYMAAKAGAAHFMKSIALELAADNITVNAIAPGLFVTNIGGGHAKSKEVQEAFAKVVPMHRCGFPQDMHGLALFLASPASSYVTGQEIIIDGGLVLGQAD
jgi:NAD(P)-dependent dehydrogenase (short-subunit alcohol dehydrogenase family)